MRPTESASSSRQRGGACSLAFPTRKAKLQALPTRTSTTCRPCQSASWTANTPGCSSCLLCTMPRARLLLQTPQASTGSGRISRQKGSTHTQGRQVKHTQATGKPTPTATHGGSNSSQHSTAQVTPAAAATARRPRAETPSTCNPRRDATTTALGSHASRDSSRSVSSSRKSSSKQDSRCFSST